MIFLRPLRACGISQPLCLCAAIPTRALIIIVIFRGSVPADDRKVHQKQALIRFKSNTAVHIEREQPCFLEPEPAV